MTPPSQTYSAHITSQVDAAAPAAPATLPSFPTQVVCDVAEASHFSHRYDKLCVPVLAAFGGDRLHQCAAYGSFDLDLAIAENSATLYRSITRLSDDGSEKAWDDLTFCFGPRAYLYLDETRVIGFADSPGTAEALVAKFTTAYSKPPKPKGGSFYLIKTGSNISTEAVPLGAETILDDPTFALHYGTTATDWHAQFAEALRSKSSGLSILEGPPGTGKTSYLRHLMGVLRETHRFYFIPTATMSVLTNPDFIGFWAGQRRRHDDQRFVVILEDSDTALMSRAADNREQVSAILNLTDGMLADFLRLQIICTINCKTADIDQALLRPGRLLGHRLFNRLDYAQATRLADSLGRKLHAEQDYSLAEVFAGSPPKKAQRPSIGFAA